MLAIHDASFPAGSVDVGRGTPYSDAGHAFFRFVHDLGFTGVQLGPQGETSRVNPSPYDATLFSRSTMALSLPPLADERVPASACVRADHEGSWDRQAHRIDAAFTSHHADDAVLDFVRHAGPWLERDGRFVELATDLGTTDWQRWSKESETQAPTAAARRARARYEYAQWLAHVAHEALRGFLSARGMRLWGDVQIGVSHQDRWALRSLFLDGYLLGAPPSRTTPDGQPWGFPVLDPAQYDGAVGDFIEARIGKMLAEYDGLRIDHPHGLIDPWVYRVDERCDALAAVNGGARLFSSPDLPDHPRLSAFAIARAEQLDRTQTRYADGWVTALDGAQIGKYARLIDRVVDRVRHSHRRIDDQLCEILSTLPYPLRCVLAREGFGRMVVTQKARLDTPADVYRIENATRADWVMVGDHDTPPIWRVVEEWCGAGRHLAHAEYLAERLEPVRATRPALAAQFASSTSALATAMFAALLASKATSVSIFFTDLLGMRELYNVPGLVASSNWQLRVPLDYEPLYLQRLACAEGPQALDLMGAIDLALHAKGISDPDLVAAVRAHRPCVES